MICLLYWQHSLLLCCVMYFFLILLPTFYQCLFFPCIFLSFTFFFPSRPSIFCKMSALVRHRVSLFGKEPARWRSGLSPSLSLCWIRFPFSDLFLFSHVHLLTVPFLYVMVYSVHCILDPVLSILSSLLTASWIYSCIMLLCSDISFFLHPHSQTTRTTT